MSGRHTCSSSTPHLAGPRRSVLVVAGMTAAMLGVGLPASQASVGPTITPTSGGCVRPVNDATVLCTFSYTGAAESWTVPEGVTSVNWFAAGAQGGSDTRHGIYGGIGAEVGAKQAVTAGDSFSITVGEEGGPQFGGSGPVGGGYGGGGEPGGGGSFGGGGATTISDANGRLIVAAGGGGASLWYPGGNGGDQDGAAGGGNTGAADTAGVGGGGATTSGSGGGGAGGDKANCTATGSSTANGGPGASGFGANGGDGGSGGSGASGGGGGGGWYGGGGGGSAALCTGLGTGGAGGGGGSSNVRADAGLTDLVYMIGGAFGRGDGVIELTFESADPLGAPSVTVNQAAGQSDPASDGPILFEAVFTQPVTGFTAADVDLSASTAPGVSAAVSEIAPNDGTTYRISVSGMTAAGTVVTSIPAGGATNTNFSTNLDSTSIDNSVTYQPDTTGPTASPSQAPAANANGWNNTDVTVAWNWSDPSGLDSNHCDVSTGATAEGSYDVTGACKDTLGNSSTATFGVKIDKTGPLLAPTVVPNPAIVGGVLPVISAGATDPGGSGIASAGCGAPSTAAIGTFTVTCTATDNAGNTTTADVPYTVAAFFGQWRSPMPKSTVKASSTLPVKFALRDANGAITGAAAQALASGKQLRVLLTDKDGVTAAQTTDCAWVASTANFQCNLKMPKKLTRNPYQLSVQERQAGSQSSDDFFTAPGGTASNPNPEQIFFK